MATGRNGDCPQRMQMACNAFFPLINPSLIDNDDIFLFEKGL
jgi:hypothetical protein